MSKYCEYYREWMWVVGACCVIRKIILNLSFSSLVFREEKNYVIHIESSESVQVAQLQSIGNVRDMPLNPPTNAECENGGTKMKGMENIVQRIWVVGDEWILLWIVISREKKKMSIKNVWIGNAVLYVCNTDHTPSPMFQIPAKILHNMFRFVLFCFFVFLFFFNWIDSKIEEILSYRPKCQAVQRSWLVDRHFCPWWALRRFQSVDDYDQNLNLFYQLQLYRRYLFDLNQFRCLHRCCFRCYLFQCVVYQLRLVKNGRKNKNREKLLKIFQFPFEKFKCVHEKTNMFIFNFGIESFRFSFCS